MDGRCGFGGADLAPSGATRFKIELLRWFPAYWPALLVAFKWLVLYTHGQYTFAKTIVDLPFASLTFDLWAMVAKINGHPLRPGIATTPDESKRDWVLILVFGAIQLGVYLWGVQVWLVGTNLILQIINLALAVFLGLLVPWLLLGPHDDSRIS